MSNIGIDHEDCVICWRGCLMRYMKGSAVEYNIKGIDNMSIWRAKNGNIDKWNIIMKLVKERRKMAIYDNKEGFVLMCCCWVKEWI